MIKHYSKGIQNEIQRLLFNANSSIKIAVAWFTNELLFMPLMMKLRLGVEVEIVLNQDEINASSDNKIDFEAFVNIGGKLHWNRTGQLMHDKFCIIDNSIVVAGSYNWTNKAEYNDESITVFIDEETTVSFYKNSFDKLCEKHPLSQMNYPQSKSVLAIEASPVRPSDKEVVTPVRPLDKEVVKKPNVCKAIISGRCMEDLTFALFDNGTLSFSGRGAIPDYDTLEMRPWHSHLMEVTKISGRAIITGIGKHAFEGLAKLESVEDISCLGLIGESAFRNCVELREFHLRNNSLKEIGRSAFEGCVSLKSASGADVIGENTFKDCKSLENQPYGEIIKMHAFSGCSSLSSFSFTRAREIEDFAFDGCTELKSVRFSPDHEFDKIGKDIFVNCPSLKEIIIPKCVLCNDAPLSFNGFTKEIVRTDEVHPLIKGRPYFRGQPLERVRLAEIPNDLRVGGAFGIHKGDTIKIENVQETICVCGTYSKFITPIYERTGPFVVKTMSELGHVYYLLAVTRNQKISWINLSSLVRCDAFGEPVGAFQRLMLSFSTWKERLNYIYGKTLKGGGLVAKSIMSSDGTIKDRYFCLIELE